MSTSEQHSAISPEFLSYFAEEFFSNPAELQEFITALKKPLPKTLRVNTNRISLADFELLAKKKKWELTPTPNPRVYRIDRVDTRLALGSTPEHLSGYFYIQELAASFSVQAFEKNLSSEELLASNVILDMSASPGGKTTQLSETFPNSFVIANEPSKDRLPQLIENTERMGNLRIGITPYNGLAYQSLPEFFDHVLLDAPCSGEGTVFKNPSALQYWRLKSVKTLARLQAKLLAAALTTLKVGGTLAYSTCTLNRFENEGVLEEVATLFPGCFDVISQERSWPHKGNTGGFFVAILRKTKTLGENGDRSLKPSTHISLVRSLSHAFERFVPALRLGMQYMEHANTLLATNYSGDMKRILDSLSLIRCGSSIARKQEGGGEVLYISGRDGIYAPMKTYILSENDAIAWLMGEEIYTDRLMPDLSSPLVGESDFVLLKTEYGISLGIAREDKGMLVARIPSECRIKKYDSKVKQR